jgi:hypothetical protein
MLIVLPLNEVMVPFRVSSFASDSFGRALKFFLEKLPGENNLL